MILDHMYPHLDFGVDTVIEAVGHKKGTWIEDLKRAFDRYGVEIGVKAPVTDSTILPEMCLLSMIYQKKVTQIGGHWILFYRGHIYDPGMTEPMSGEDYMNTVKPNFMSYYEIKGYK